MNDHDAASSVVLWDEIDAPTTANFLLYGEVGAGKSTAAATAPGPILWVNAEGPGALAYPRKVARERGTALFEARIRRSDAARAVLRQVAEHVKEAKEPEVQTVVVDTVAKVRDALIRGIVTPGAKNTIQQFGEVAKVLEDFVVVMRDLPVNLILLCHEEISDTEGERIVQPLIGGTLTQKIPGEMDIMAYCGVVRDEDAGEPKYLAQLVAGKGRRAKDRSGGALGQVRGLDLSEWLTIYHEALMTLPPETDGDVEEAADKSMDEHDESLLAELPPA